MIRPIDKLQRFFPTEQDKGQEKDPYDLDIKIDDVWSNQGPTQLRTERNCSNNCSNGCSNPCAGSAHCQSTGAGGNCGHTESGSFCLC